MYFVTAAWRIDSPGLYYDEALPMPPAARVFESCDISAGVYRQIKCIPVVLQPPYLGALKANLYGILFSIVEPNIALIRAPMIVLHFLSIAVLVLAWRKRIGPLSAIALFAMLCTDAAATFHARIDWGPYAIATFFKVVGLTAMMDWIETRRPAPLIVCAIALILGVFDKLNFIWVVGAFGAAGLIVYGKEVVAIVRERRLTRVILLVAAIAGGLVTLMLALLSYRLNLATATDLLPQVRRVFTLLTSTVDGSAFYGFVFRKPWLGLDWASRVLIASTIVGSVLVVVTPLVRARLGRDHVVAIHCALASFLTLILIALFVAMVATKEVGGSHHLIVVSLFWQLQVILCGVAIASLLRALKPQLARFGNGLIGLVVGILLVQNAVVTQQYLAAVVEARPGNNRFTLAINDLVALLDRMPNAPVVSVDWGTGNSLVALAKRGTRHRFLDHWPSFSEIGKGNDPPSLIGKILGPGGDVIFVMHPRSIATFPTTNDGFALVVRPDPTCAIDPIGVQDHVGQVQYHVIRLPKSCLVSDPS